MTTIYSDSANNKYLGDCQWGNHDINYPTTDFLLAHPHSTISQGLIDLCNSVNININNVLAQPGFDSFVTQTVFLEFAFSGDNVAHRYDFGTESSWNTAQGSIYYESVATYDDSGVKVLRGTNAGFAPVFNANGFAINTTLASGGTFVWSGVANSHYMSLVVGGFKPDRTFAGSFMFAAGTLLDINTGFNYYSANRVTKTFMMCGRSIVGFIGQNIHGGHYISSTMKDALTTGRAAYTISCSDGQTPGAQWATDMWVYDDNAALGYPVIGRVPNMLLGVGSYTYLKPVKIQGSVFPDNGSPWYLPVGAFAGKTLLMRCYSSVS